MTITDRRLREALDKHASGKWLEDQLRGEDLMDDGVVVLASGGQDSTTCMAWAGEQWGYEQLHPIAFDYGQKHRIELTCVKEVCTQLGVKPPTILKFEALKQLRGAALTDDAVSVGADATGSGNQFAEDHGLPSTFVPGRNLVFFALAASYGAKLGIYDLVTGVCEADRAGYPDCRSEFVASAEDTLKHALDNEPVTIHAPLLKRNKAETWKLAKDLGILPLIVEHTHTCYHGDRRQRHEWGYGCGDCPACIERARGYEAFLAPA